MTKDNSIHSEISHILSKLHSAQRSIERLDGLKTVKENIKYIIEDLQEELEYTKEVENGVFVKFHDPKLGDTK